MSKKDVIRLRGEVTEVLPDSMYRVKLDNDQQALCVASGRMRKNFIRVVVGDRVVVEFSPYDLTRGRIVYRES
ncbi:MAG: translation initiation factor IF-1 [Candidatus Bipolaricaulota bacterium]|nr:translation initiation factor IF-1 [Candidatus Bipolaricaulota bacterium]